jgi:hypothetical protein
MKMLSETSKTIVGIIIDQLEKGDKKGLKEYGVSIDDADDVKYQWNLEAMQEMADALKYQQKEIEFLKQRNKDLRQKSWYQVYVENLELQETLKIREEQLLTTMELKEEFYCQMIETQSENKRLKEDNSFLNNLLNNFDEENQRLEGVIKSVETFLKEHSI